jgi:uncharacterized membrane protein
MEVITMRFVITIAIVIVAILHGFVSLCNAVNTGTTFWYVNLLLCVFIGVVGSGYVETQSKP